MKVSCPSCASTLNIDDKKIPASGARIKCPTCQTVFPVKPAPAASAGATVAVPLPGAAAPTSINAPIPLPGVSAPRPQSQTWEDAPTRAVPVTAALTGGGWEEAATSVGTIPGARSVAAPPSNARPSRGNANAVVPLPGISAAPARSTASPDAATRVSDLPVPPAAIPPPPLPSSRGAVPLPGAAAPPRSTGSSIPLPGAAAPASRPSQAPTSLVVPLPGNSSRESSSSYTDSIPLPGQSATIAMPAHDSDLDFEISSPSNASGAVPLPGSALSGSAQTAAMPPLGGEYEFGSEEPAPAPADDGFSFPPPPDAAPSFDFAEPPPPEPQAVSGGFSFDDPPPAEAPAPAPSFDFAEPPPPSDATGSFDYNPPAPASVTGAGDFSFDAPPPPAPAAAPGAFDFGPPPPARNAPANADLSFDFNAPPAQAAAPSAFGPDVGFGEVDLGGGGNQASDLEFDPSASAKRGGDDLEADLSAPLHSSPGPTGPADGLEMLSFIDDTAKEAGTKADGPMSVRRFHVKRRSGKVFGPFEEAVVIKMLEDGQLLGNEEVSLDTENWQPVGSEPTFQAVIAKLMEAPSRSSTQQNMMPVDDKKGPSMERLKQLYEGRMAAVAVVQGKEPVPFKKRLPYIAAGLAVALVLGTGITLGVATPYGFFGLKVLFPAKVRADTREFGYLQSARKGFLTDTWKSYKAAKESAAQALAIKEFPEARAVWAQAVFYLSRKYDKAEAGELDLARSELVNIKLLGEKDPEVLKTMASDALTRKQADEALGHIADALARDSSDPESLFLRAEAFLQKKQVAQAKTDYETILKKDPKSAKALHALALIHKSQNAFDEAAKSFGEALVADPTHTSSSVELAEIEIVNRHDVAKGTPLLETALGDAQKSNLSTSEMGKALALKAETLVVGGKMTDAVPLFEEALKADPNNPFTQARLGRVYLDMHDPDKAVKLFQKAVAQVPESLDYSEGYLLALIAVGRMDEATKVVQQATTRFPDNAMLSYLSARVSDALDNSKDAEEAYKRAIARATAANTTIPDAYLYLARLYTRFRRFAEAEPQLEAGLEKSPDSVGLHVGMGELAFFKRDLDRAEKEFKRAIELEATMPEANLGLSQVSLERGKFDLAEAQVEKALETNARISGGKLQQGIVLWKLGRYDESIAVLSKARVDEPKNAQITVTLGAVAFEKGDLDSALKYLNSALVSEPGHPDGNFYMARVQNAQRNHTQAIEAMKRALDFNAKNPLYHYWMGRFLNDAKKTDDAIGEWKQALELEPAYADALESMGKVYFDRNDFKRAVKNFEEVLKVDPSRIAVRAAIGDAQMKLEDWDGAIASYNRALEADPELKNAHYQVGQAYEEKKLPKKAIEAYLKAATIDEKNADAWLKLGWLYKGLNKKKDEKTAFLKYLEIRPNADDKKQIEDELEFLKQ